MHLRTISPEKIGISIFNMGLKMTDLILQEHVPGTNELRLTFLIHCRLSIHNHH